MGRGHNINTLDKGWLGTVWKVHHTFAFSHHSQPWQTVDNGDYCTHLAGAYEKWLMCVCRSILVVLWGIREKGPGERICSPSLARSPRKPPVLFEPPDTNDPEGGGQDDLRRMSPGCAWPGFRGQSLAWEEFLGQGKELWTQDGDHYQLLHLSVVTARC